MKIIDELKNKREVIRKNEETKVKENGITLIALVITIIVLLILAAVSIATLTGNNGILTRTNDAKTETEEAKEDELRRLTALEAATNLENTTYTDNSTGEKKTVIIPAETAVSQVEGENTLKDGLVIIDKNGNEWVWIEVPKSITESATTEEEIKNALINYVSEYRANYTDTWYEGCGLSQSKYKENYSKMLQSIKLNGGFYIGRYEVGIKEDVYRNFGEDYETEHPIDETPVIQQDKYVYNWVTCSQAEKLSEKLSTRGKTSTLMFGIQWDLVLRYLELNGNWDTTNDASYYLKTNSSTWGNYSNETFNISRGKYSTNNGANYLQVNGTYKKEINSNVLLTTGATERNSKMNIYDLAGNVRELTLEKSYRNDNNLCAIRGSYYILSGETYPVSTHSYTSISGNIYYNGFRPTLY